MIERPPIKAVLGIDYAGGGDVLKLVGGGPHCKNHWLSQRNRHVHEHGVSAKIELGVAHDGRNPAEALVAPIVGYAVPPFAIRTFYLYKPLCRKSPQDFP